ncbi:hypothetical protein NUKP74_51080 [Klebsiella quasipneumoniae]|nr:hypothetical protein NUKP74_51080 [Klebsiella quasipneumoniae]
MKKRFSDEQIICILREAEAGVSARELCRKHAISDATFYTWRKKYGGMEVPEVKRLKSLEEENARLKKLLAEAMLDKTRSGKPWKSCARLRVCRNVVPAGWQVCPCQPADIRLSVRLLTRSCLYASQSWHLNAAVLVTGVSGSFCDVKVFALTTSGFTASINLMA